nr:unnamed protein product [Callosobruchus chinensis]
MNFSFCIVLRIEISFILIIIVTGNNYYHSE